MAARVGGASYGDVVTDQLATSGRRLPATRLPVADPGQLAAALLRIGSVSGDEGDIADAVVDTLQQLPHLEVLRDGNCVLARTNGTKTRRVLVAGHLDTVPQPSSGSIDVHVDAAGTLWGRGAVDMLGGVAMALHVAATVTDPVVDVTYVFYDCEEVAAERNGLGRLVRTRPDWLAADLAILGEPTSTAVEGGCQGSLTIAVTVGGRAGHAARAWLADNAIHAAASIVQRVTDHPARRPVVDGLEFREGLQVVGIGGGGPATNVVPDRCRLVINHRFAPDRDVAAALATVQGLVEEAVSPDRVIDVVVLDAVGGARPGLGHESVTSFAAAVTAATGKPPRAKLGWTDVARFAELGIPAVNFGPGDPGRAHADDERVDVAEIHAASDILSGWMTGR